MSYLLFIKTKQNKDFEGLYGVRNYNRFSYNTGPMRMTELWYRNDLNGESFCT